MNRLKERREKLGLTQKQVAESANISKREYLYCENSERIPNVRIAIKIAKALKISTFDDFILLWEDWDFLGYQSVQQDM